MFPCVLRSGAVAGFGHLKIALPSIDGHQVSHQLPGHRQCRPIGIALLFLLVIEQGQLRAVARRHFGGFDQRGLQMFVALFGDRCALYRVRRTFLVSHLECPRQCGDRPHGGNTHPPGTTYTSASGPLRF